MNTSFSKPSNQSHQIRVESQLIYAMWISNAAYADCEAMLEIRTSFVGDGAEVKIKGRTEEGSNLGKVDTQIFGNRLIVGFPMPQKLPSDELAYVEVTLPKQKLEGESNRIPTRPAIVVSKMQWSAKEARRGDELTLTVDFSSNIPNDTDAMVVVYEYDMDGNHDPIAKIPATVQQNKIELQWKYEYHEDTDEIPTQEELQKYGRNYNYPEYFFVVVIDGVRIGTGQESGLLRFKDYLEISPQCVHKGFLEGMNYVVDFADGKRREGVLNKDGSAFLTDVPPGRICIQFEKKQKSVAST